MRGAWLACLILAVAAAAAGRSAKTPERSQPLDTYDKAFAKAAAATLEAAGKRTASTTASTALSASPTDAEGADDGGAAGGGGGGGGNMNEDGTQVDVLDYLTGLKNARTLTADEKQALAARSPITHDQAFVWNVGDAADTAKAAPNDYIRTYSADLQKMVDGCLMPTFQGAGLVVRFGDGLSQSDGTVDDSNIKNYPLISKARLIGDTTTGLLPLNFDRHWGELQADVVEFEDKADRVVWRGVNSGDTDVAQNQRFAFVNALNGLSGFDIKFSKYNQGSESWPSHLLGGVLGKEDMLKNRYLLSLPGNDVATGLGWMLASQSVVVMPHPESETFLAHGLLQPWVHYVPLNDATKGEELLSTLRQKDVQWHKKIISKANQFVRDRRAILDDPKSTCHVLSAHAKWFAGS